ncbi:MAG TPA: TetR/AcrR family transcriptional regulator [Trebonia sp.]|nr:TetR/AcrR family transcriptional regulator [Trebonia sp.]
MAEPASGRPAGRPLPPALELLWGRRRQGRRGPRPGLSADAIVDAAVRVADAEGLEAISMARVAAELGFTTMSLYRHVGSKEELLQLMFNASALGAESVVLDGDDWRSRLRSWATLQREVLDLHPWITQMPMPAPPLAPNSLHFLERGLEAFDGTGLADEDKLRVLGLIASYSLNEARMANDAARGVAAARAAADQAAADQAAAAAETSGESFEPPPTVEDLLRELVDSQTFPHLYDIAWSPSPAQQLSEREEFMRGVELILDGVQALIDRARGEEE